MAKIELKFNYPDFIKPALFNDNPISIIPAGRQTGKTYNSGQWILDELITADEKTQQEVTLNGLWVDTTNSNIEKYIERVFKKVLKPVWQYCDWKSRDKILYLPPLKHQRPFIDFGSAERPENLEGQAYYRGVLNEGGIILKKASLWDTHYRLCSKVQKHRSRLLERPKVETSFTNFHLQTLHIIIRFMTHHTGQKNK